MKRPCPRQSILYPVPNLADAPTELPTPAPGVLHRLFVAPFLELLHFGASPRHLAWSIAIGAAVGLNPLLGSTTLLALAAAAIFRLNLVASQLAAHLAYPLEIVLFFLFIRAGDRLFHTGRLPLHREALLSALRHHPWDTTRLLWKWEWHAFVVWAALALVLTPLAAMLLTAILQGVGSRMHPKPSLTEPAL